MPVKFSVFVFLAFAKGVSSRTHVALLRASVIVMTEGIPVWSAIAGPKMTHPMYRVCKRHVSCDVMKVLAFLPPCRKLFGKSAVSWWCLWIKFEHFCTEANVHSCSLAMWIHFYAGLMTPSEFRLWSLLSGEHMSRKRCAELGQFKHQT